VELHLGMRAHVGVLQYVFGAAVGAGCLHALKVARLWRAAACVGAGLP
jgi:hypothetical protein